jgi:hypothetical protein
MRSWCSPFTATHCVQWQFALEDAGHCVFSQQVRCEFCRAFYTFSPICTGVSWVWKVCSPVYGVVMVFRKKIWQLCGAVGQFVYSLSKCFYLLIVIVLWVLLIRTFHIVVVWETEILWATSFTYSLLLFLRVFETNTSYFYGLWGWNIMGRFLYLLIVIVLCVLLIRTLHIVTIWETLFILLMPLLQRCLLQIQNLTWSWPIFSGSHETC